MKEYNVQFEEALLDLMDSFVSLTQKDMDELAQAFKDNNISKIESIAHTLKGDSGGYGFDDMSLIAKQIEHAAKAKQQDVMLSGYEELKNYWLQLVDAYKKL